MAQLRYVGTSHVRELSSSDLASIGIEDHLGLIWNVENRHTVEVEDDVAAQLAEAFPREFYPVVDPNMVEEKTLDELKAEARTLKDEGWDIKVSGTKEQLADAIAAVREQQVTDSQSQAATSTT